MEPFLIELKFLPQANSRLLNLKIKVLTCSFGAKFTRNVAKSARTTTEKDELRVMYSVVVAVILNASIIESQRSESKDM